MRRTDWHNGPHDGKLVVGVLRWYCKVRDCQLIRSSENLSCQLAEKIDLEPIVDQAYCMRASSGDFFLSASI